MTTLARTAAVTSKRSVLLSEKMLHKRNYDSKGSAAKKSLAVSLKGLQAKTNCLAVNNQS
jgi:hypothetical protein